MAKEVLRQQKYPCSKGAGHDMDRGEESRQDKNKVPALRENTVWLGEDDFHLSNN